MKILIKRVYEDPTPGDGYRVLVDRLWPRGMTKDAAALDLWDKELAPSTDLRKQFHADPEGWGGFRKAYRAELRKNKAATDALLDAARASRKKTLTLLYASRDEANNHAVVLRDYLNSA